MVPFTICRWPFSLENERSCRDKSFFHSTLLQVCLVLYKRHCLSYSAYLTSVCFPEWAPLGKLLCFCSGILFHLLGHSSESEMSWALAWVLANWGMEILGTHATFWDPLSWSQSLMGSALAFQDIIKAREKCSPFLPSPAHGVWRQTYFKACAHMSMISEAWKATE